MYKISYLFSYIYALFPLFLSLRFFSHRKNKLFFLYIFYFINLIFCLCLFKSLDRVIQVPFFRTIISFSFLYITPVCFFFKYQKFSSLIAEAQTLDKLLNVSLYLTIDEFITTAKLAKSKSLFMLSIRYKEVLSSYTEKEISVFYKNFTERLVCEIFNNDMSATITRRDFLSIASHIYTQNSSPVRWVYINTLFFELSHFSPSEMRIINKLDILKK